MAGWDGSRKRKRSPQGFDDPTKTLIFEETKLTLEDEKTVECQFSFSRQACPTIVCKLSGIPDQQDPVRLFNCPRPAGAAWLKCMLSKGQELVEKCQALTKEYRTDARYSPDTFHLEFHVGRRQVSRSSHSHIVLPVHAYYQFRMRHFKVLRASSSLSSDVTSGLFFEHWPRYFDSRRRYLEDTKQKHRSYQREDDDILTRLLQSMEKKAEEAATKSDAQTTEKTAAAKADSEQKNSNGVDGAAASSAEEKPDEPSAVATDESKPEQAAEKGQDEPMETSQVEATGDSAAQNEEEKKSEEEPMQTDAAQPEKKEGEEDSSSKEETKEDGSTKEETKEDGSAKEETKEDGSAKEEVKTEEKLKVVLSSPLSGTVAGLEIEYTFDAEEEGNPVVHVRFVDIPSLAEATASQLESMITALYKLCEEWRFNVICTITMTVDKGVRIIVDVNSFVRHLNADETKVWASRWKSESTYASPTARATREDLEALEKNEPGSLVLESWADY